MSFFNTITNEQKIQSIDARLLGVKQQLYGVLMMAGVNPETFDIATFDPLTEIDALFAGYTTEIERLIQSCNLMDEIRQQVLG